MPNPSRGNVTKPLPSPKAEAGRAGGASSTDAKCVPLVGRFLLSFNKAEIVDILEQASRWTCRNFAYTDEIARGKISLLSKTPVTAEEAYAAFLAALTSNNIAIYPSGKYYKLVRITDAKKSPIPTLLDEGAEVPAMEQPVTKIFRLHYVEADQMRGVMGNFTSPQGADIQSIPPDVLIVTDIGLNVRRIERMLETLDRPGSGELIRFIQVRYATARDMADKINQIFQSSSNSKAKRSTSISGVATSGHPGAPPSTPSPSSGESDDGSGIISISKVMADERTNKLVVIADEKSFERIKDLVEQLDVPTSGEGQIHVVFMKNSNAEDLAQSLQSLAQGSSSKKSSTTPGAPSTGATPQAPQAPTSTATTGATSAALFGGEVKITADKVANALLIMANGADFATLQRLIDKLDKPRRQVFVEAAIIEVNLQDENQFGISMHAAIPIGSSGYIPITSQTGTVSSLDPLTSIASLGGLVTGAVGSTSSTLSDLGVTVPSAAILVQALQKNSNVNVISTPTVLATDNEDAEITVGQNVPFQMGYSTSTSSSSSTSTSLTSLLGSSFANIQRQNVELKLHIKPQITEGDNVRLTIDEATEEIASKDAQLGPTTAKRTIKTSISVKDQGTIVIGGLIQDRTVQSIQKTPFLGDLPVLGYLFRNTSTTKYKTNLLLFLTPYIIHDQSDYRRIYEKKRTDQQEFMRQFYGTQSKYEPPLDYSRKASPFTRLRKDVEAETIKLENGGPGGPGESVISPPKGKGAAAPAPAPTSAEPAAPTSGTAASPAPSPRPTEPSSPHE